MHDLAIIMPTRDRPDIVLRSLRKTRERFANEPIFVFDDASKDGLAVADAVSQIEGATLLRSNTSIGPAGARKRLISAAEARWLLAIDDDCYPHEHFDPERWTQTEPGASDPIVVCFRCYRPYDGDVAPSGHLKTGPFHSLMGGASLLHRKSVIAIGSYNAAYVFGGEDTDLARRVWASGRELWIDTNNFIIHDHVAAGRDPKREAFYYVRNRILIGVLTLPLWYGLPLGLAQAIKRWLNQPYKLHGLAGIAAGLFAAVRHFGSRRPLTLRKFRWLSRQGS